ncbi:uncharacterized protein LOC100211419 isoform X3 [Hydra vulgaris]|uniref:Uncharacterized protein LOC100211419 isoform X3 n=1 Tax=Hydra vulgaris TaxID=6087 RepID=A0ABM4BIU2_HYDVU
MPKRRKNSLSAKGLKKQKDISSSSNEQFLLSEQSSLIDQSLLVGQSSSTDISLGSIYLPSISYDRTINDFFARKSNSSVIEVIDVEKLPDRPLSPVNCDDVMEINPPSLPHSRSMGSRLNVVDLTDIFSPLTPQPLNPQPLNPQPIPSIIHTTSGDENDSDDCLPNVLKSFTKRKSDSMDKSPKKTSVTCSVCLDNLDQISSDGRKLTSTICGHIFCDECIFKAVKTIHSCPTCRMKLTKKQLHPIFL